MRHKLHRIIAAAGFAVTASLALPCHSANTLTVGNCMSNSVTSLPVGSATGGAALFYPASYMEAYKGCSITDISVSLDTPAADGALTVFLSHDLNGEPFYAEAATATKRGWNKVTLSTPYDIDGKPLYIGYKVADMKYLSYANKLVSNEEWVLRGGDGWQTYDGKYSACITATMTGASLPQHNVRIGTVRMPEYVVSGQRIEYSGQFQNLGAVNVKNLTLTYMKDGVACKTETVSGLNVAPRTVGTFVGKTFSVAEEGVSDISIVVSAVNGKDDAVPSDNESPVERTTCRDSYTKRTTLLEFFSTEQCTACPSAHNEVDRLFEDVGDLVEIGHHSGFNTDQFTIPESTAYEWFYNPVNVHAPAVMFDRTNLSAVYPELFSYGVPMTDPSAKVASLLYNESQAVPAIATVRITPTLDGRTLKVGVDGSQLLPVATPENVRLYVFLTEDSIYTTSQAGASSGYYQRFVARKSLTPMWGDAVQLASYSADYTAELPEEWNIDNMRVVAFLANYNADDKNDCRVLNCAEAALKSVPSAISLPLLSDAASAWTLHSASGELLASGKGKASLQTACCCLGKGVYVVSAGGKVAKIALP